MNKLKINFNKDNIKAILFDSGKVLNFSTTGHWFISPKFFDFVDKQTFNSIKPSKKKLAFSKAYDYIKSQNFIQTEAEEYMHFLKFYKIFSEALPELNLSDYDIENIAKDYVYNYGKYIFFDDALSVVPNLAKSYKLGIISDAWPSLEGVFINKNFRKYFDSFVISSQKGITKPNDLMYRLALTELNISPNEAIFIDDNPRNCEAAERLGIHSFVLCRNFKSFIYTKIKYRNLNIIRSLDELKFLSSSRLLFT
ncbi:HAD-IA family hydrolase [Clostridium sp. B9]|uniref:HAD-IA family hydrolase n=1 Tax=Clostridium sp. B9 TaxID=3423224 RepID=UPI003D2F3698